MQDWEKSPRDSQVSQPEQAEARGCPYKPIKHPWEAKSVQSTVTYSQTVGKDSPTKALERYSVYISLETPSK